MNAQSIRRSVLVSLLAMPLSAMAQNTAQDAVIDAAPPPNPSPKLDLSLDLWPDRMGHYLTTEQLQVIGEPTHIVDATPISEEPLEDVMISGKRQTEAPPAFPIAVKPCGLASVVWAMEHPAAAWRLVVPIAFSPEWEVCLTPDTTL